VNAAAVPVALHAAPSAGFDEPFEMLAACHERVERMLRLLARLEAHLASEGADLQARLAARNLMRYFDHAAEQHHEDEERHVLPRLRERGQGALADRLLADHAAMAESWARLRRTLHLLAEQGVAPSPALDGSGFAARYREHIRIEEEQAFPAAVASLDLAQRAAMGREMAARRGLPA
jgi:hemerythrin-like domain-containing protein